MGTVTSIFPPIHTEGVRFILIFAAVSLVLFLIWEPLGWIGVVLTVWCVFFFRDPDRYTPVGDGLVISPADGIVCFAGKALPPPELELEGEEWQRISIFMNVFNCHVNRAPMSGTIVKSDYHPGKFLNASLDKASEDNERHSLAIHTERAGVIGVVQIAGLVARRIVCDVDVGDVVKAGERFGIIRFGSRVDVYLKADVPSLVAVGQTSVAGETVLADVDARGPARDVRLT